MNSKQMISVHVALFSKQDISTNFDCVKLFCFCLCTYCILFYFEGLKEGKKIVVVCLMLSSSLNKNSIVKYFFKYPAKKINQRGIEREIIQTKKYGSITFSWKIHL